MQRLILLVFTLLVALGSGATRVAAQVNPPPAPLVWQERTTEKFSLIFVAGSEAEVEVYAGFVDDLYEEIAAVFSHRTATPLPLRLFPTYEEYLRANPQARELAGVVAHADLSKRELAIVLDRAARQTEEEIRNNVRHELTHIVAADLSGNRLNVGFQEGTAQYLERLSPEIEQRIAALRSAADQGLLLSWSDLDRRERVYGNPEVGYPQSLSVVAFLVERDGFAIYRDFLTNSARSSGYRSALERTYGLSANQLESEWLAWLPSYLESGYRRNALTSYDLSFPARLVSEGRYAEAQTELSEALSFLEQNQATQPGEVLAEARELLRLSQRGVRAEELGAAARDALASNDLERAATLLAEARLAYAELGDGRQAAVFAEFETRINVANEALGQLQLADQLGRELRLPAARAAADVAAQQFAQLGDQARLAVALELRQALDRRQQIAGAALLLFGLGFATAGMFMALRRQPDVW